MRKIFLVILLLFCIILTACQKVEAEQPPAASEISEPTPTVAPTETIPEPVIVTSEYKILGAFFSERMICEGEVWTDSQLQAALNDPKNDGAIFKVIVSTRYEEYFNQPSIKDKFREKGIKTAEIDEIYSPADLDPLCEYTEDSLREAAKYEFVAYVTKDQLLSFRGELTFQVWLAP